MAVGLSEPHRSNVIVNDQKTLVKNMKGSWQDKRTLCSTSAERVARPARTVKVISLPGGLKTFSMNRSLGSFPLAEPIESERTKNRNVLTGIQILEKAGQHPRIGGSGSLECQHIVRFLARHLFSSHLSRPEMRLPAGFDEFMLHYFISSDIINTPKRFGEKLYIHFVTTYSPTQNVWPPNPNGNPFYTQKNPNVSDDLDS